MLFKWKGSKRVKASPWLGEGGCRCSPHSKRGSLQPDGATGAETALKPGPPRLLPLESCLWGLLLLMALFSRGLCLSPCTSHLQPDLSSPAYRSSLLISSQLSAFPLRVFNQGWFWPPSEDIWLYLEIFLMVTTGQGTVDKVDKGQRWCLNILQCTEQFPTTKNYLVPNVSNDEVKKSSWWCIHLPSKWGPNVSPSALVLSTIPWKWAILALFLLI